MKVLIQVTQNDIAWGFKTDVQACPIALAMARVLGHRFQWIGSCSARVDGRPVRIPLNASVFIRSFDYGIPVQPFQFTLDIPDPEPAEDHP